MYISQILFTFISWHGKVNNLVTMLNYKGFLNSLTNLLTVNSAEINLNVLGLKTELINALRIFYDKRSI